MTQPTRADHHANPTQYPICGRCNTVWRQHGNRTGHCAKCHQTFQGLSLFDQHQTLTATGQVECRNGADMAYKGHDLENVDGTWFGPKMDDDAKARRFGRETALRPAI